MKFALFTVALLSAVVQDHSVNAVELGRNPRSEIEQAQTWTEIGPVDMVEDYFVQSGAHNEKTPPAGK